jgi:hypothetical protein
MPFLPPGVYWTDATETLPAALPVEMRAEAVKR